MSAMSMEDVEGLERKAPEKVEQDWQRLNRELLELLNELRITLPAAMVLFAFLLIIPFNPKFAEIEPIERAAYLLTFFSTAIASVLLIAPSIHHRLRWRQGEKDHILRMANRLAIIGTTLLAVGIGGAVFLVTDIVLGIVPAAFIAIGGLVFVGVLWFALPAAWAKRSD